MSNPWEDFQNPTITSGENGPWDDFQPTESAKPNPLISSAKSAVGSGIKAFGTVASDVGLPALGQPIQDYGQGIVDRNPANIRSLGDIVEHPLTALQEGVGNAAGSIPASVAGAWAGAKAGAALPLPPNLRPMAGLVGAGVGAFAPNLIAEYGQIRDKQGEEGYTDKGQAFTHALGAAGLETLADTTVAGKFLPKPIRNLIPQGVGPLAEGAGVGARLAQAGKAGLIGAGVEGGTEAAQSMVERAGANQPLNTPEAWQEAGMGAALGALGGGPIRGGIEFVSPTRAQPGENQPGPLSQAADVAQANGATQPLGLPNLAGPNFITMPDGSVLPANEYPAYAKAQQEQRVQGQHPGFATETPQQPPTLALPNLGQDDFIVMPDGSTAPRSQIEALKSHFLSQKEKDKADAIQSVLDAWDAQQAKDIGRNVIEQRAKAYGNALPAPGPDFGSYQAVQDNGGLPPFSTIPQLGALQHARNITRSPTQNVVTTPDGEGGAATGGGPAQVPSSDGRSGIDVGRTGGLGQRVPRDESPSAGVSGSSLTEPPKIYRLGVKTGLTQDAANRIVEQRAKAQPTHDWAVKPNPEKTGTFIVTGTPKQEPNATQSNNPAIVSNALTAPSAQAGAPTGEPAEDSLRAAYTQAPNPAGAEDQKTGEQGSVKQPQEMTRSDFMRAAREGLDFPLLGTDPTPLSHLRGANDHQVIDRLASAHHRAAVTTAIVTGNRVPPEVLADYPDLQEQPNAQAIQQDQTDSDEVRENGKRGPENRSSDIRGTGKDQESAVATGKGAEKALSALSELPEHLRAKTLENVQSATNKAAFMGWARGFAQGEHKQAFSRVWDEARKSQPAKPVESKAKNLKEQIAEADERATSNAIASEFMSHFKGEAKQETDNAKREEFLRAHESLPFAGSLIHNDYEKAVDDIFKGRIARDKATKIFEDAKKTGMLSDQTIKKVGEEIDNAQGRESDSSIDKTSIKEQPPEPPTPAAEEQLKGHETEKLSKTSNDDNLDNIPEARDKAQALTRKGKEQPRKNKKLGLTTPPSVPDTGKDAVRQIQRYFKKREDIYSSIKLHDGYNPEIDVEIGARQSYSNPITTTLRMERSRDGVKWEVHQLQRNEPTDTNQSNWRDEAKRLADWLNGTPIEQKPNDQSQNQAEKAAASEEEAVEKAPTPEPVSTELKSIEDTEAFISRIDEGRVTPAEMLSAWDSLQANIQAVLEDLRKRTKVDLAKIAGGFSRASEPKERLVSSALSSLKAGFHLKEMLSYGMDKGAMEAAIRSAIEQTTQDEIDAYAAKRKARIEESKARLTAALEGIKDPQTVEDFNNFVRSQMASGKTLKEARFALSPEQRAKYDELRAVETRGKRAQSEDVRKTTIRTAEQAVEGRIIETKHTKKGHDLFVVQLGERVSREDYTTLNASAKRLGGYYSSFRGAGAVPGFQFTTREAAEAFNQLAAGDTSAALDVAKERRDAFLDDRTQSTAERLREMADRLDDKADSSLSQDRKANTARRADMAARAERAGQSDKALAETMRRIADRLEKGEAVFLDRVRQKVQVEFLRSLVHSAQYDYLRAKYPAYIDQERHRGEKPTPEVADYAEFPSYTLYRSDLARLGRQLLEVQGTKQLGQSILKVADDVSAEYLKWAKENLSKLRPLVVKDSGDLAQFPSKVVAATSIEKSGYRGKAIPFKFGTKWLVISSPSEAIKAGIWEGDNDKRITLSRDVGAELVEKIGRAQARRQKIDMPWQLEGTYDRLKRLSGMGIETPAEFRAMLREFVGLQEQPKASDRVKELERAMVGRRKDGLDFFPTPSGIVDDMLDAADIKEGMSVLEPSAGMGHIAESIRDAGVEPDVVELSGDRRELLEAKGFNVVEHDFMDYFPQTKAKEDSDYYLGRFTKRFPNYSKEAVLNEAEKEQMPDDRTIRQVIEGGMDQVGFYDRIIMNPPFSDRRDVQHVQHAYDLLKPGGRLVAIMGEGSFFGTDKKAQAFREWLESVGGTEEKLPEGSFNDPTLPVTTGVNARMVVIDKPEAKYSKSPVPDVKDSLTAQAVKDALTKQLGKPAQTWLDSGRLVIAKDAAEAARLTGNPDDLTGVKAFYAHDTRGGSGKIILVADALTPGTIKPVLLHEVFHSAWREDAKLAAKMEGLMKGLESARKLGKAHPSTALGRWVAQAEQAVKSANTPAEHELEEFAAYALEQYERGASLPARIVRFVKDLLAHIRAALAKLGYTPKYVSPSDLSRLTKEWLRNGAGEPVSNTYKFDGTMRYSAEEKNNFRSNIESLNSLERRKQDVFRQADKLLERYGISTSTPDAGRQVQAGVIKVATVGNVVSLGEIANTGYTTEWLRNKLAPEDRMTLVDLAKQWESIGNQLYEWSIANNESARVWPTENASIPQDAIRAKAVIAGRRHAAYESMVSDLLKERADKERNKVAYALTELWKNIADSDHAFVYGTSDSKDIHNIAEDMAKGVVLNARKEGPSIELTGKNGGIVIHNAEGKRPYISAMKAGSNKGKHGGGTALYQVALTWAHNNDRVMVGDPAGLTTVNILRRTENMISSALRHGTTKHLSPHAEQKVAGLTWKGNDAQKIAAMLSFSADRVITAVPVLEGIHYDFMSGDFLQNGKRITDDRIEEIIAEADLARDYGVGLATAKRAIITRSAVQELHGGKLAQSLFDDARRVAPNPILYSKAGEAFKKLADDFKTDQRPIKERAKAAVDATQDFLSRISPLGTLPNKAEYLKARYLTQGQIADVDAMSRSLYESFKDAGEFAPNIYEFLTTAEASPGIIKDADYRKKAVETKRLILDVGQKLVDRGLISEDTYEANKGAYLPQLYLRSLLKDSEWVALGTGKRPSTMGYTKGRKLAWELDTDGKVHLRDKETGQALPDDVALSLGPIVHPGYLAAKGYGTQMRDVALLDWLAQISKHDEWILPKSLVEFNGKRMTPFFLKAEAARIMDQATYYDEADRTKAMELAMRMNKAATEALNGLDFDHTEFKQMPNTKRYGMLRGLIVRKEIYDDIVGATNISTGDMSVAEKLLGAGGLATRATQWWKWAKVAANPPSQVRNFVSNAVLLHLSGVPFHRVPQRIIEAIKDIRANGEYWKVAKKYGVTESTFAVKELPRIDRELLDIKAQAAGKYSWAQVHKLFGRMVDWTGDIYQLSEAVFKTAKIMDEMKKGKSESDAALEAQKWLFDYSLVSPSVRYLRNAPIGAPFLTFATKALPRMLEVAVKHPLRFAPYMAIPFALTAIIAGMNDVDDDDVDKLKKALPEWLQKRGHAYLLPYKDENGRWQAMDFGYFFPWAQWTELASGLGRGDVGEAFSTSGLLGGPLVDLVTAAKTGIDPFTQKKIMDERDPAAKQVSALMGYLYRMAAPTWLTDIGAAGHLYRALNGYVDKYGEPKTTVGQAALRLGGVNLYPIDPTNTRAENIKRMRFEISDIKRRRTMLLKDRNLDAEARQDIVEEYQGLLQQRMMELQDYAKASEVHPKLR